MASIVHRWGVVIGTDELGTYQERIWRCHTFASMSDAHRVASSMNAMYAAYSIKPGVRYYAVEWSSEEAPGRVSEPGLAVND